MAFTYIDVTKDRDGMKQMLRYSGNSRQVPVIVEGEKVTIGFGGS
jgi:glutaredoxin